MLFVSSKVRYDNEVVHPKICIEYLVLSEV